jgi:hypothetical protein
LNKNNITILYLLTHVKDKMENCMQIGFQILPVKQSKIISAEKRQRKQFISRIALNLLARSRFQVTAHRRSHTEPHRLA